MIGLKPCPFCGSARTYKNITLEFIEITCAGCWATVRAYPKGKTRRYETLSNCCRYVMPIAVGYWNALQREVKP